MKYIIPSYKRSGKVQQQTLSFLKRHDIDDKDIWLVTRTDDPQAAEYSKIPTNHLVLDVKGIGKTHNAITDHFDEGDQLIEIDDDLIDLCDKKRESVDNFKDIVELIFDKLKSKKLSYAGTYSVLNPMFMSSCDEYTTELRYCLGCLRFRINRKEIKVETDYSEDFENCILHYLMDGGILKCNHLAPKTKNYCDGGCDSDGRDFEKEKEAKQLLATKYPTLCEMFERKNGRTDLRLKDKRHKQKDARVFVINAYPDRRAKYDSRYTMFKAHWWEDISDETIDKYHFRYNCKKPLRQKIAACSESHRALLQHIVDNKLKKTIIIEDDAVVDFDRIKLLDKMKDICYIGGQMNTVNVKDYGKLNKQECINKFVEGDFQTIDVNKFRITHNMGYYIPRWEQAAEILSLMPKAEKFRAIDVEFYYLQRLHKIRKFVYPAIATLNLVEAKKGFTYNNCTSYKLHDNQLNY
tara:strand:+ start:3293 stop:4687 length:1395 start_codon:yes stop_codon:yes gene_type:complete